MSKERFDYDMPSLFDSPRAYARHTDPPTSHEAADSVNMNDLTTRLENEVCKAIWSRGERGANWDELHQITGIDKASISPRFKPLRKKKLIKALRNELDELIKRPGESGRGQIVWVAYHIGPEK